ncbi:MAG TPA: sigma-70 family RNA polymerase sigma factor [Polyangiales bacterium]|nr:sigma-70 family RNA polymerase sigma factor [Polyangiales bacterium]
MPAFSRNSAPLHLLPRPAGAQYSDTVVQAKPQDATEEAFRHLDALYAFAFRLCHDSQQAQDLVQETFARCLGARRPLEPDSNVKAWLFRILRNAFIDQRRRDGRSPIRAAHDPSDIEAAADRGGADLEQLRRLQAREIDAALRELPEDQRSVVLLDVEGFSELEISQVMGCAPGTVKSRLFRARAALRERLQEYAR